jgi:hypothetical protein
MNITMTRLAGGAICVIGAAMSLLVLFIACVNILVDQRFPVVPRFTTGTVVNYDMPNTDATWRKLRSPLYFPVVSYRDYSGAEHLFLSDAGSAQRTYAVGDRVRVVYSPHSKGGREVVSSATTWGARVWLGWVLTLASLVCILPLVTVAYALLIGRRLRKVISMRRHAQKAA